MLQILKILWSLSLKKKKEVLGMWALSITVPIKRSKKKRSKGFLIKKKKLQSIYSWCFVLCETHLYSLQTIFRNETPHFQSQGSRESIVAVSNNVFKFRVCFSVGVIKIAPSYHSHSRRIWVGKGCKKNEKGGWTEVAK